MSNGEQIFNEVKKLDSLDLDIVGRNPVEDVFHGRKDYILNSESPRPRGKEGTIYQGARILRGNIQKPSDRRDDLSSYRFDENVVIDIYNDGVAGTRGEGEAIYLGEKDKIFVGKKGGDKYLMSSNAGLGLPTYWKGDELISVSPQDLEESFMIREKSKEPPEYLEEYNDWSIPPKRFRNDDQLYPEVVNINGENYFVVKNKDSRDLSYVKSSPWGEAKNYKQTRTIKE
jgi:hypothetical protein